MTFTSGLVTIYASLCTWWPNRHKFWMYRKHSKTEESFRDTFSCLRNANVISSSCKMLHEFQCSIFCNCHWLRSHDRHSSTLGKSFLGAQKVGEAFQREFRSSGFKTPSNFPIPQVAIDVILPLWLMTKNQWISVLVTVWVLYPIM